MRKSENQIKFNSPKYELVNIRESLRNTYVIIKSEFVSYYTTNYIIFAIVPFINIRFIYYGYRETDRYDFHSRSQSLVLNEIGTKSLEEYYNEVTEKRNNHKNKIDLLNNGQIDTERERIREENHIRYEESISEYSRYIADRLYVNIRNLENKDDNEHLRNSINAFD